MSGVHRFLVTSDLGARLDVWAATAAYANWIEGRDNGDRETWLVTCYDEDAGHFLNAARARPVTVEEIQGAGDDETYALCLGEPGTGWSEPPGSLAPEPQEDEDRP